MNKEQVIIDFLEIIDSIQNNPDLKPEEKINKINSLMAKILLDSLVNEKLNIIDTSGAFQFALDYIEIGREKDEDNYDWEACFTDLESELVKNKLATPKERN